MGFKAIVKTHILRELTAPSDNGDSISSERENKSGIHEGSVTVRNGTVSIRYSEPEGSLCTVSFPKDDPGIVTLTQKPEEEADSMILVLEEGQRHICINRAMGENIEITTNCRSLENTVLKNGRLRLQYSVELHGFRVERVSLRLEVRKFEEINI